MNCFQRFVVETATGPPGADASYTMGQAYSDYGLMEYCNSQIIQKQRLSELQCSCYLPGLRDREFGCHHQSLLEDIVSWARRRSKGKKGLYR